MASESQWRWVDRNGVQRVLSFDTLADALRNGALGRDVPVWREGMPAFMPAGWVPELENACTQAPLTTAADAAAVGEISPPTQTIPHGPLRQKHENRHPRIASSPCRGPTLAPKPHGGTPKTSAPREIQPTRPSEPSLPRKHHGQRSYTIFSTSPILPSHRYAPCHTPRNTTQRSTKFLGANRNVPHSHGPFHAY